MKKTAKNDVTGDTIKTKPTSDKYRENYEKIFGKKEKKDGVPRNNSNDTGQAGIPKR